MSIKNTVGLCSLLLSGFLCDPAQAFTFTTCNGNKVVWDKPFAMVQNTFSIAPGGMREQAMDNAINRWNGVRGMFDMISKSPITNPTDSVDSGDGRNDVAVVTRASIGGNNGLTFMIGDGCIFNMSWIEADVNVASDLTFTNPEETSLATNGRLTFMHEFGHAVGLDHAQGFNNMRATQPRPLMGGSATSAHVDAHGDDARGGRFLYPSGNSEVNLYASAHRRNVATDTIVNNNPGSVTACSSGGGKITINSTVGNNGTVNVTQTERWWVSQSKAAHGGGVLIGQWNNSTFVANTAHTRLVTWTLPPLAVGTWFLYHGVDVFNVAAESREDDNAVREALVINVIGC